MLTKIESIKALREMTGVSMGKCKDALEKAGFDQAKALEILREMGAMTAADLKERKVSAGRVMSYIHGDGRIGVLLQVNCETDFVANNDDFKSFMHDVCLQIAGANPLYVAKDDVPNDLTYREQTLLRSKAKQAGKPPVLVDQIVAGQMQKWFEQICLIEQRSLLDPDETIGQQLNTLIQKTRENIRIVRFSRFEGGTMPATTGQGVQNA